MKIDSFTLEDLQDDVEVSITRSRIVLKNGVPRLVLELEAVDSDDPRRWLYIHDSGELGRLM